MTSLLSKVIRRILNTKTSMSETKRPDVSLEDQNILNVVKNYSMTGEARLLSTIDSIRYIETYGIPGDIVECGVWRGGNSMAAAIALKNTSTNRELYLYDTYEGMTEPSTYDKSYDDVSAEEQLKKTKKNTGVWCYAAIEEVKENMKLTGYPENKIRLVKGPVERTIPNIAPEKIALLRLDTDWYESTKHELEHLYHRLSKGGVLIIDDYGHWKGAKQAVDEFFAKHKEAVFFHRLDYTGRIMVKLI